MSQSRKCGKDPAIIAKLSPEQRRVTQLGDTEMPGTTAIYLMSTVEFAALGRRWHACSSLDGNRTA